MNEITVPRVPKSPPLEWIRGFALEDIGQRENESQFQGEDSEYPVDWAAAEEDARLQWAALKAEAP